MKITPGSLSQIQPSSHSFCLTSAKIVKAALYALSGLSTIAAGAIIAGKVTVDSSFSPATTLIALSLLLGRLAWQVKDYKDPIALQKMQKEAKSLSYARLSQLHGAANIIRYKILPENAKREDAGSFLEGLSAQSLWWSLSLSKADHESLSRFGLAKSARVKFEQDSKAEKSKTTLTESSYKSIIGGIERSFQEWVLKREPS